MRKILPCALLVLTSHLTNAQTAETVALGAGGTTQIWYSLLNGEAGSAPVAEWDFAFESTSRGGSVLFNAVIGNSLWVYPGDTSEWNAIDTSGISNWPKAANSDTSWSHGAFNSDQDPADMVDMGWGIYNINSMQHPVVGNRLFIIKTAAGLFKKMWIESLISGTYTIRIANLDGSNEVIKAIEKNTDKSFVYYNMATNQVQDREPAKEEWDLLFTRYAALIPGFGAYPVTGVLQAEGVTAAKMYPVDDAESFSDYDTESFTTEINTIGYDWKSYNMGTSAYEIADSTVYFVQAKDGAVWKLIMTGYESANTVMSLTKEKIGGALGVERPMEEAFISVYPNPTINKRVSLAYSLPNGVSHATVHIADPMGRLVANSQLIGSGLNVETLDLSGLNAGSYYITVAHEKGTNTQTLIVR